MLDFETFKKRLIEAIVNRDGEVASLKSQMANMSADFNAKSAAQESTISQLQAALEAKGTEAQKALAQQAADQSSQLTDLAKSIGLAVDEINPNPAETAVTLVEQRRFCCWVVGGLTLQDC